MNQFEQWKMVRHHWLSYNRENGKPFGVKIDGHRRDESLNQYHGGRDAYEALYGQFCPLEDEFMKMIVEEARLANFNRELSEGESWLRRSA